MIGDNDIPFEGANEAGVSISANVADAEYPENNKGVLLSTDDLIYPMFVVTGNKIKKEIQSMPGNYHLSEDMLLKEVEEIVKLNIPAIILFGIPENRFNNHITRVSNQRTYIILTCYMT